MTGRLREEGLVTVDRSSFRRAISIAYAAGAAKMVKTAFQH
jgi:hypothetical protein